MAEQVAPEFIRFIDEQRRAGRLAPDSRAVGEGEVFKPVLVSSKQAVELLKVAARVASGMFRPSKHTEVVWVEGGNELAVGIAGITVRFAAGEVHVQIPVRCDQTGEVKVNLLFVVGSPEQPSGLYAATAEQPRGPELIVNTWGAALVAFAWQCLLGLVSGVAGASGKDARGNLRVPVELAASARGLEIVPMTRHRFAGSSQLKPTSIKQRRALP